MQSDQILLQESSKDRLEHETVELLKFLTSSTVLNMSFDKSIELQKTHFKSTRTDEIMKNVQENSISFVFDGNWYSLRSEEDRSKYFEFLLRNVSISFISGRALFHDIHPLEFPAAHPLLIGFSIVFCHQFSGILSHLVSNNCT